jgi:hypothetical protein
MRSTLSPAFTSSKMKTMFVLLSDCCQQFVDFLEQCYTDTPPKGCNIERGKIRTFKWENGDVFVMLCLLSEKHSSFYSNWPVLIILTHNFRLYICKKNITICIHFLD